MDLNKFEKKYKEVLKTGKWTSEFLDEMEKKIPKFIELTKKCKKMTDDYDCGDDFENLVEEICDYDKR